MNVVVLTAGMSQRMGSRNKMLLPFQDSTVLETTIINILNAQVGNIIVVIGNDEDAVREKLSHFEDPQIVLNNKYLTGQVSSVKAGLRAMTSNVPFMIALGDMPLIKPYDYNQLIDSFSDHNKIKPTILRPISTLKKVGNPVLFDFSFKDALLKNDEPESSRKVIQDHRESLVFFQSDENSYYRDIDTPEDYEKLISSGL